MRLQERPRFLTLLVAVPVLLLAVSCNESSTVSGPAVGSPATTDFSGTWTGEFLSEGDSCAKTQATAVFQQNGSRVTGSVRTQSCDLNGTFVGTVHGDYLTGSVGMIGCTGGAASGRIGSSGELTLSVDELKKELVSQDAIVMPGGTLRLQR